MRFNNAFMCKSGEVGMQFNYGKDAIITIYHDGKALQNSEGHKEVFVNQAYKQYAFLHKHYRKH